MARKRYQAEEIIRKAGLEPWPKVFQNLRSTRETELAAIAIWSAVQALGKASHGQSGPGAYQGIAATRGSAGASSTASSHSATLAGPRAAQRGKREDTLFQPAQAFRRGI